MTDPVYIEMDRADVVTYLGPAWPPLPGTACLAVSGVTDGLVCVYPVPGMPGYAYWAVDACVPPQAGVDLTWLAGQLGIDPSDPTVWTTPVPVVENPTPPEEWTPPPSPYATPHTSPTPTE